MENLSELHLLLESLDTFNEKVSSDEDFFKKIKEHARSFKEFDHLREVLESLDDEELAEQVRKKTSEFCTKLWEDKEILNKISDKSDFVALLKAKLIMSKKRKEVFSLAQFDKEELETLLDAIDAYQFKTFHDSGNSYRTSLITDFFERSFSDDEVVKTGKSKVEIMAIFKKKHGSSDTNYKVVREAISLLKTKLILTMQNRTIDELFDSSAS